MRAYGLRSLFLAMAFGLAAAPLAAQTQSATNASAAREAHAADQALNAQYKAASARLSPASRLLLRDAQRSWIAFRDSQCKFETSGAQGGSAYPLVQATCLKALSRQRTQQLRRIAACQEGDLACPR
ncbi:DUF1311 domain-containing protein [Sphingomonas sp. ABOLD]|nr:DUF1311 domain-containing protein [Sphingomonas sp. ABOLE]RSV52398.1 DUF1311 domain-containing protein [Sphingomonas sp. ABOLD]